MNKEKKYIGFDLGAESGRCVVAILKENKLELKEVHRFPTHNYKNSTGYHWDIKSIFSEITKGLKEARKSFGAEYESIGVDTWGVDYALIGKEEELLNDPFHYRDNRTDNIMKEAFDIVSQEKMYNLTGTQFQQFNTVFQLLAEIKSDSEKLKSSKKIVLMPDYLNFLLSGEIKSEYTIASTTGLVNPMTRDWAWELIDKFNIPRHIFPEIVEPGTKLGNLLPKIVKETGLNPNIPIIASAGHDTAAAVVSVPVERDNWAFLSSGTWSLMGVEITNPVLANEAMQYNFTNEGGIENTIRFLKNIIGLWPIQECRRYWLQEGRKYTYQMLLDKAVETENTKRWLNLNDQRFMKPDDMPEKIISYLNETNQNNDDAVGMTIRTVLESLAINYKKTIEEIEKVSGKKIEVLHAVGGGIQNELLTQLTADALGIDVIAGPIEGTIVGNIGVQAIATKSVKNLNEWRKVVRKSFNPKVYKPHNTKYFEDARKEYDRIIN